jgi:hypothetical protein
MDEQAKARRALERAFKRCKSAGFVFCGMDNDLLSYDAEEFMRLSNTGMSPYDIQGEMQGGDRVETHETYIDSGGW